jgi:nitroimidazol reductase NimA-like FMN-containing flavoprotein (pyridoxamine 5'-phosphate oxidase superfamily)
VTSSLNRTADTNEKIEVGEMAAHEARTTEHEPRDAWPWPAPPDPGDLSRRIIRRRTELKLSVAQVATRARLGERYVEYLERFPARPSATALRQLAAALRTTPAALLGGAADVPPGHGVAATRRAEPLTSAQCRRLIAPGGIGRIALVTPSGQLVFPVNYAFVAETIVIRTGAGSAIAAHASDRVAFEVDRIDDALAQGWSVLVRGRAHPVLQPGEHRKLTASTRLRPWPEGEHELFVRIVPEHITGRRIEAR